MYICKKQKKATFRTKTKAREVQTYINTKYSGQKTSFVYKCPDCKKFHLTTKKQ